MPLRHILLALLVVAIWGVNFTVIKLSVNALPPILAAGLRFAFASWPLIFFVKPPKSSWRWVFGYGMAFGVGLYIFLNFSMELGMPAGLASVVLQVQAFFTMLIAYFVLRERPKRQQIIGAVIAFLGIGIMALERVEGAGLLAFALTILAALSWGCANVIVKKIKDFDALSTTVWSSLVASIVLLAISVLLDGPDPLIGFVIAPDLSIVMMLVFLAYPATLLGGIVWNWLLSVHPASMVAPFTLLVPITGLLSGWIVLGETISRLEMAGGGLIVFGIAMSVLKRPRRLRAAP